MAGERHAMCESAFSCHLLVRSVCISCKYTAYFAVYVLRTSFCFIRTCKISNTENLGDVAYKICEAPGACLWGKFKRIFQNIVEQMFLCSNLQIAERSVLSWVSRHFLQTSYLGCRAYGTRAQNGTRHSLLSQLFLFLLPDQWRICVYLLISDCVEIVYELPLLPNNTAKTNRERCEVLTGY